jgi:hypothetical protein
MPMAFFLFTKKKADAKHRRFSGKRKIKNILGLAREVFLPMSTI